MTTANDDLQDQVANLIAQALSATDEARRTELLVTLLHRSAVELNKVARARTNETKGQAEWGSWAGLQNTTRSLVLQASTCRDVIRKIAASAESQS